jgi:hypothetical protein
MIVELPVIAYLLIGATITVLGRPGSEEQSFAAGLFESFVLTTFWPVVVITGLIGYALTERDVR